MVDMGKQVHQNHVQMHLVGMVNLLHGAGAMLKDNKESHPMVTMRAKRGNMVLILVIVVVPEDGELLIVKKGDHPMTIVVLVTVAVPTLMLAIAVVIGDGMLVSVKRGDHPVMTNGVGAKGTMVGEERREDGPRVKMMGMILKTARLMETMIMKTINSIGVGDIIGEIRDANGERMVIDMNDAGGSSCPAP